MNDYYFILIALVNVSIIEKGIKVHINILPILWTFILKTPQTLSVYSY